MSRPESKETERAPAPGRRPRWGLSIGVCALLGFGIVLWGGYDRHWHWTGFSANDSLWDWLHLLLLPIALATVPIWLLRRETIHHRGRILLAAMALTFTALVIVGYALDLAWTGFPGNELWDWLELLVLPLAVAAVPLWNEIWKQPRPIHTDLITAALTVLTITIIGGYALDWDWTGFQGNTLWDWLQLFLVPLAIPLIVVPAALTWLVRETNSDQTQADSPEGRSPR